jgi:hypothetical protein
MSDNANIVAATRKELFSVECTTCKARLKVRSMAAIGQILSCPKCQSMVMVAPPADWQPEGVAPPVAATETPAETAATAGSSKFLWKLAAAAGGASLLCGVGVYAVWRQFPPVSPTIEIAVQSPPVEEPSPAPPMAEAPEQPDVAPEVTEPEPAVAETAAESPLPAPVDPPVESTPAVETPDPAPAIAAEETPAEPESPPVEPVPETPPPVVEASSSDDVLQRLRTTVAGIDEPSIRLDALAELLGGLAACPITLDAESLRAAGLSGETVATVQVEEVSIATALAMALEPLGLTFEPRGKAIVIVAAEK